MILGYVCTNYNNTKYTIAAINSLITEKSNHNTEIVVVDNCSDNENIELLKAIEQRHANVHIIYNNENLGYFKGLNCGIYYLRQHNKNIEYIVIGNNDLVFSDNFYESVLSNKATLQQHAVVSPNIITLDGVHQNPHVINGISKFREIVFDLYFSNYYLALIIKQIAKFTKKISGRKDVEQFEVAQTIYQGYGACYILCPLFFRYFDSLWAPTFLMGEELFLSKQLESKKLQIYYEPSLIVNHHFHATMDKIPGKKYWEISRESHRVYRKYVKIW
ncbi:MAG: glycosyltransferase [bacterium]